jgi:hypothetical protein
MTQQVPLYFNYIGTMHNLLAKAIASIKHPRIKVCIHAVPNPVPFTKCLNAILSEVDTEYFFFMHYDAEITDQFIFDKMLAAYSSAPENTASITACNITDLLVLYNTKLLKRLGGWDEGFKNSYMELDLRRRIHDSGMLQPILYDLDCPPEVLHKEASALRNPTKEGNISYIYDESFIKDATRYYAKYNEEPSEDVKEMLSRNVKFSSA